MSQYSFEFGRVREGRIYRIDDLVVPRLEVSSDRYLLGRSFRPLRRDLLTFGGSSGDSDRRRCGSFLSSVSVREREGVLTSRLPESFDLEDTLVVTVSVLESERPCKDKGEEATRSRRTDESNELWQS